LHALASIREQGYSDWEYLVVGEGPEIDNLVKVRNECALSDKVRFLGRISDRELEDSYGACDVFAHPQVTDDSGRDIEGFGLVIADAMAWGLPVVVGRDGGPSEFVLHGRTGYVVDGYDIEEIAEVLKQLITHPELRRTIGIAARAWAIDQLAWSKHIAPVIGDRDLLGGPDGDKTNVQVSR
jgi:glycosyltransferase involved in cell wall biosynthesis